MQRITLFILFFLLVSSVISCRSYPEPEDRLEDRSFSLRGMGAVQSPDNDDVDSTYSGGIGGSYHFSRFVSVELNFFPSLSTEATERENGPIPDWKTEFEQNLTTGVVKVNLISDERFRPYVGAGANFVNYTGFTDRGLEATDVEIEDATGWTGVAGVIIDRPEKPWSFFAELWYVENEPDVTVEDANGDEFTQDDFRMNSLFTVAGVSLHF